MSDNAANDEIARQHKRSFGEQLPRHSGMLLVVSCAVCGSLVDRADRWEHAKWHAAVEQMLTAR